MIRRLPAGLAPARLPAAELQTAPKAAGPEHPALRRTAWQMTAWSHVLLRAALLFSALALSRAQQATLETSPVDWNSVPTSPNKTRDLSANCICDLRDNECDLGCCCDAKCPAGVTATYRASHTCLPEGPRNSTLDYCVPKSFVRKARRACMQCMHAQCACSDSLHARRCRPPPFACMTMDCCHGAWRIICIVIWHQNLARMLCLFSASLRLSIRALHGHAALPQCCRSTCEAGTFQAYGSRRQTARSSLRSCYALCRTGTQQWVFSTQVRPPASSVWGPGRMHSYDA